MHFNFFPPLLLILFAPVHVHSQSTTPPDGQESSLPARVPYIFPAPGTDPIADALRARRTNGTLLDLDGVTLNAPIFALAQSGATGLFSVIRSNNTLPADMREDIILRIMALLSSPYQWIQHEPIARSVGVTTEQLTAIRFAPAFAFDSHSNSHFSNDKYNIASLSAPIRAALAFTDHLTLHLVEATVTAAGYNMGARVALGLNVGGEMDMPVPIPM
ncbi:hypothetical protein C8F01DRAFT_1375683 [Mycena amicta]|nr:hypothetical protein C8F01DRAFT_1375683 [Mycena amicta]